jgi:hypothetical protein
MKNKKSAAGRSIFALWEKASKSKNINETATPNQAVGESSASHNEAVSNLQLALVQAPDAECEPESSRATPTPIVEDEEAIDEEDEETRADLAALEYDLAKRISISRYEVNDHDEVMPRCSIVIVLL